jgi:hypothetical protein
MWMVIEQENFHHINVYKNLENMCFSNPPPPSVSQNAPASP